MIAAYTLVAVSLVLVTICRYGPELISDSTGYVGAARHILAGEGFRGYDGAPFVSWPPLFPLALAALGWTGGNIVWLGGILNALAYGAIVFVSGRMLYRYSRGNAPVILGTLCVALGLPLFSVATALLTESLFILLVVLFLWQLNRFLEQPRLLNLVLASVLVALASLTRYIGVTLGVSGCVLILLFLQQPFRKRLAACLVFGVIAAAPLAIWLARNWLIAGTLTGERAPSTVTLIENISRSGKGLAAFVAPRRIVYSSMFPGVVSFVVLVGGALVMAAFLTLRRTNRTARYASTYVPSIATFSIIYLAMLLVSATLTAFDGIGSRFLSPLYVPGVLLGFLTLDELVLMSSRRGFPRRYGSLTTGLRVVSVVTVLSVIVWMGFSAARDVKLARRGLFEGAGYNSSEWWGSETIAFLRSSAPAGPVFSNAPGAVYFLADISATMSPAKRFYASSKSTGVTSANLFERYPGLDGSWLVWFNKNWREYLLTPGELERMCILVVHAEFEDGTIYQVHATEK